VELLTVQQHQLRRARPSDRHHHYSSPTPTPPGRWVRCGVPATGGTWRGDAIAAQPFTHRSRDLIVESATEARHRYLKTSNAAKRLIW